MSILKQDFIRKQTAPLVPSLGPPPSGPVAPAQAQLRLNMIVKDEAPVIVRCLESVREVIADWCIVDTGSTDGTQDLIRKALAGIPGELHERPWVGFSHNRNEAIDLAFAMPRGASHLLFIDADEQLHMEGGRFGCLWNEANLLKFRLMGHSFTRVALLRVWSRARYEGAVHEQINVHAPLIEGPWVECRQDGARSRQPDARRADIALLEGELKRKPNDSRLWFLLGQTHRGLKQWKPAIRAYRSCIKHGLKGSQDVFMARLLIAKILGGLSLPRLEVEAAFLEAIIERPWRAEALGYLALYLRLTGHPKDAMVYAEQAAQCAYPPDTLLVEEAWYRWRAIAEVAACARACGDDVRAQMLILKLQFEGRITPEELDAIKGAA